MGLIISQLFLLMITDALKTEIPIQRMVWIKGLDERVHIYLYPSFVIKRCPFPTSTLEYIWENCIIPKIEPFDRIKDPNNLLDSSLPLEYYTKKIFNLIGSPNYIAQWNNLYYKTLQSLPYITDREFLKPNVLPPKYAYHLIQLFVKGINFSISSMSISRLQTTNTFEIATALFVMPIFKDFPLNQCFFLYFD